jgi:hypothetical protein
MINRLDYKVKQMPTKSKTDPNEHIEETLSGTPSNTETITLERGVVYDATITRMHHFTQNTEWGPNESVAINFDDNTAMFTSGYETADAKKFMVNTVLPVKVKIQRVQKQSTKSDHMVNRLYITVIE